MALSLPYPNSPQDGDAFLSLPVRSNVNAITQAIQSFDGTQVQAGSIQATALASSANPITRGAETLSNFVSSGCIWSAGGGLLANMTAGTVYVNGVRVSVLPVTGKVLSVSTDYYVDVDTLGNLYYLAVGFGATAPALTGNSIRIAKLTANATVFAAVVQYGFDSLENPIYGYKRLSLQVLRTNSPTSGPAYPHSTTTFYTTQYFFQTPSDYRPGTPVQVRLTLRPDGSASALSGMSYNMYSFYGGQNFTSLFSNVSLNYSPPADSFSHELDIPVFTPATNLYYRIDLNRQINDTYTGTMELDNIHVAYCGKGA